MTKNKGCRIFKIYMGIHTPKINSHTKFHENWLKNKEVMVILQIICTVFWKIMVVG